MDVHSVLGEHRLQISVHPQVCVCFVPISSLCIFVVYRLWLPAMGNHALVLAFYVLLGGIFLLSCSLFQRSEC